MKKQDNPLDALFRERLDDFRVTPSPEARKRFLDEAGVTTRKKRWKGFFFILLSVIVVIFGIVISTTKNEIKDIRETRKENTKEEVRSTKPVVNLITSQAVNVREIIRNPDLITSRAASVPEIVSEPVMKTEISSAVSDTLQETADLVEISDTAIADTIISVPEEQPAGKQPGSQSNIIKNRGFSAGIYYTPEWMFNLQDENVRFCNNFGFVAKYNYHQFFIGTGAGISMHKGSNEYLIETNKYEGTYQKLESMTFDYDPVTHKYIPNAITVPEDVYDTAVTYTTSEIKKQYVYLQVPLILGYDFYKSSKIDAGISAGPVLSILLSESDPGISYDPGKDRIIRINDISPDRIHTNWQISGEAFVRWKFTKRFAIETGPQVKYYFNSIYEKQDNTDKPWSLGLRTIIWFAW